MKFKYAFFLGRAGCGKSTLYRELERRLMESGQAKNFERVDDFPILWAKFERDDALESEGKERLYTERTGDGGYILTDGNFLNDLLKEVNANVLKIEKPDHMIFLEFARPNYVEAIGHFDKRILECCIVIYMQVSFETCWARNVARHEGVIDQDGDDHMVSREAMEAIFLHDDRDAFIQQMADQNTPVAVVDNDADGDEHLKVQVEELLKTLF